MPTAQPWTLIRPQVIPGRFYTWYLGLVASPRRLVSGLVVEFPHGDDDSIEGVYRQRPGWPFSGWKTDLYDADGALVVALGCATGGGDRSGLQGISVADFDREQLPRAGRLQTVLESVDVDVSLPFSRD
ncbi:hypothetical protein ABN028_33570 [Actinopolymorpha sp. B17G11]|uniref:hypothetical protein n=1 Tax=Actinopolymorpha sp. B17G11 TaxID=3160861 RepID=UPI0032E503B1